VLPTSNLQIDHSHIHDINGRGIVLEGAGLNAQLSNLEIDHCSAEPIDQTTVDMNPAYFNIDLNDNLQDVLVIPGGTLSRNLTLDGSPAALNGAPILLSSTQVPADRKMKSTPSWLFIYPM